MKNELLYRRCETDNGNVVSALRKADISIYADSMQSLVHKDIQNSLAEIEKP